MNDGFTLDGGSDNVNEVLLWHNVWNFCFVWSDAQQLYKSITSQHFCTLSHIAKCEAAATFIWISAHFILTLDKNKQSSLAPT